MKTLKDFLNKNELNYKEYVDYLITVFSELGTKNNQETLRTICENIAGDNPEAQTATEVLIQNCSGILHELQMQKDSGYPNKKDEQIWNSLHYFQQYFKDWKETLLESTNSEDLQLENYSFNLPGEDSVDLDSFFNADLFSDDTLQSYSGRKWPEPEKIIVTDDYFFDRTEKLKSGELFPEGSPKPEDVHQTTPGTCYMLGSLRSLARTNPQMLKSLFRDVTDETVTIRFYSGEGNKRTPVDITVDRTVIKNVDTQCASWVRLFEKAYAVYHTMKIQKNNGMIEMRNAYDFDAPSFFEALMPIEYHKKLTTNEVVSQPNLGDGKKKFIELLTSAIGPNPNTVMTLTRPHHVVELTGVTKNENGVYVINYIDQFSPGELYKESISVDELFNPKSPFDTISVIQLNGNMPATHVSFYPQSCAKQFHDLNNYLSEISFVEKMTAWFAAKVTERSDKMGLNPLCEFARDDKGMRDFLAKKYRNDIQQLKLTNREFLNQRNNPDGPNSIFKGFADEMAMKLYADLLDAKQDKLALELKDLFAISLNNPTVKKQNTTKEQPKPEPPKQEQPKPEPPKARPMPEPTKTQPKQVQPKQVQPKQTATKVQPKHNNVEKLKAAISSIKSQISAWEQFAEAHKDLEWNVSNFIIPNLRMVRDALVIINDGDISKVKSNSFIGSDVKNFLAYAVVVKFLEREKLPQDDDVKAMYAGMQVKALSKCNDISTSLMEDPEQFLEFFTDPNPAIEQLLKDPTVKECLDIQFPHKSAAKTAPNSISADGDEIYYSELVRLNKALKKTDNAFSNDTDQYKYLHSYLEKATAELGKLKKENSSEFSAKLSEHMRKISDSCQYYKESHKNLKSLSSRQMQRIKVMNRLEWLQFRRQEGVNNPTENVDYMLGDKLTQAYMMQQIQGKNVEKYIHVFCDAKKMDEIIKNLAEAHPMQKAHGKRLPDDMKVRLLKTPCTKLYANGVKLLSMPPEDYKNVKNHIEEFLNAEPQKPAAQKQAAQQKVAPTQALK